MKEGYQGVWVFAEQEGGKLSSRVPELLGCGRSLAQQLGAELAAILMGSNVEPLSQELIEWGADKVYLIQSPLLGRYQTAPYSSGLKELVMKYRPEVVIFASTDLSRDLAPRVACALGLGLTAHCVDLKVDKPSREVQQICPFFDFMAINRCDSRPQLAVVLPGIAKPLPHEGGRKGEVVKVNLKPSPPDVEVVGVEKMDRKVGPGLEEAERVIGVGRGVRDIRLVQELASALGAQIGGTQLAVDDGLLQQSQMIGVSGVTVKPKLYIACAISGTSQHTIGMKDSEVVVAINQNRNAPIFKVADYGIIGDVHAILPLFTKSLRKPGRGRAS